MMDSEEKPEKKVVFDRNRSYRMTKELCDFVGKTLIKDVECPSCKHKNKTKDDWVLGFGKDECEKCGEELPLEKIYGGPPKDYFTLVLDDEEPACNKITRALISDNKPKRAKKEAVDNSTLLESNNYVKADIPDPIADGLKKYIQELEQREKEASKPKKKSIYDDPESGWGNSEF